MPREVGDWLHLASGLFSTLSILTREGLGGGGTLYLIVLPPGMRSEY